MPNDGTRLCLTDAGSSSYYDGALYDYVFGLSDRFFDIVHVADQSLWNECTQSQLATVVVEPSNVRLSLCMDGLTLNGEYDHTYSYWLVILTSYNLPPGMCISYDMFLKMVIPEPSNPKHLINVYLELLIEELQKNFSFIWYVETTTWKVFKAGRPKILTDFTCVRLAHPESPLVGLPAIIWLSLYWGYSLGLVLDLRNVLPSGYNFLFVHVILKIASLDESFYFLS
ncbi:hypothetical protein Sango_0645000 [Sesamum angolense]|uniref:Uncharacterized protein n=1 Tax=Sesamum angolense TaxID=2727404 RepID=A0AAE2C2K5_9LAMI|nr:hypothetical protein Sango_0645000 [Sesamum angolense]